MTSAPEQLFWGEVRSSASTRRSLAVCYALLIAHATGLQRHQGQAFDWRPINEAVNAALALDSHTKIDGFRKMAWSIHAAAAQAGAAQ